MRFGSLAGRSESGMSSGREFRISDQPIHVNDRHRRLHYQVVARAIVGLLPHPGAIVLDHGCGEALNAGDVAGRCARLYLCDPAPQVREALAGRHIANVSVIAPEDVFALPDASLDLIVAHSLCYVTRHELGALLDIWHAKLKPAGTLVLADIIPRGTDAVDDALALLRFAWRGGFLIAALGSLVRAAVFDRRRLRAVHRLTQYGEEEMLALLEAADFTAARLPANLGHDQQRMAFAARRGG